MELLEIIIFYFLSFVVILTLILWLLKRVDYIKGKPYNTDEIITLRTLPRVVLVWFILLFIFYILEINKFHLLYIFPITYLLVSFKQSKRIVILRNKDMRKKVKK